MTGIVIGVGMVFICLAVGSIIYASKRHQRLMDLMQENRMARSQEHIVIERPRTQLRPAVYDDPPPDYNSVAEQPPSYTQTVSETLK